jgi:hypothetical protein
MAPQCDDRQALPLEWVGVCYHLSSLVQQAVAVVGETRHLRGLNAAGAIRILALAAARAEVRATINATLGDAVLRAMPCAELERMAQEALAPRHLIRAAGTWARIRAEASQNSKHSQRPAKRSASAALRASPWVSRTPIPSSMLALCYHWLAQRICRWTVGQSGSSTPLRGRGV